MSLNKTVALVGMMGAGKTSMGKRLAERRAVARIGADQCRPCGRPGQDGDAEATDDDPDDTRMTAEKALQHICTHLPWCALAAELSLPRDL